MTQTNEVSMTVNGERVLQTVPVRMNLVDFLRNQLGLTGSHVGCEHGVCGACTIEVDGEMVRGCLLLAVQADGSSVTTLEGITASRRAADLQDAFHRHNALQCGFCT
ncbi:MAG: 2Fe-2S iron-sulfur cluster binding domain-containing protein, partial [Hyphomicrobiaceae bacterium]